MLSSPGIDSLLSSSSIEEKSNRIKFLEIAKNNVDIWNNLSKEGNKTGFSPEKEKKDNKNNI